MLKHYGKSYLLVTVVFLTVSLVGNGNMFFVFYPCLLCGMIPANMLSYDERSGFLRYSAALPYTKAEIVSEKYLLGLFSQLAVLIVTGVSQGIKMKVTGTFAPGDFFVLMLSVLIVSLVTSSISLPFMFRSGVEKGRLSYYIMIGFVCAASVFASDVFKRTEKVTPGVLFTVLAVIGIGVYLLSWYLSIRFFEKREL